MNDQLIQDGRVATLHTPLGTNKLALSRFEGYEGISELFEFRVNALSKSANINFDDALGLHCTVNVAMYAGPKRFFDGILVEAQTLGTVNELYSYSLVLRPALWLLSRTTNCRIWHDEDALAIIKKVLGEHGVQHRSAVQRDCRKREYCVQYRETDLAFVSRLMEEEGIYYFFNHSDGQHMMVLGDAMSSHKDIPGHTSLHFSSVSAAGHVRQEALLEWTAERKFRSGKFELRDYNFKTPNNKLKGDAQGTAKYAHANEYEVYDYPGKYDVESEGKTYAGIRRDAEQALDWRRHGAGEAPSLFPGGLVTLKDHPRDSENQKYLVLRANHQFSAQSYRSNGFTLDDGDTYHGNYEFFPADKQFRMPMVTPRPIVYGPHTAKVSAEGHGGEEIYVDKHGRINVLFHWDRDEKYSCWVRVAQVWAGSKWGGQFIPRIGMEVVVEFLEGDPDRPLVVGCVYNEDNKYPWDLPDNKTQSGIKSRSTKGGGPDQYNQLRFEDLMGKEQIEIHAQKDLDTIVLNNETQTITNDRTTLVKQGNHKETIKQGNQEITVSQGNQTVEVTNGKIHITAGVEIVLKVGSSTITLDQSGITIKAPQITQDASATMETKAGAQMTIKAAMIMIN